MTAKALSVGTIHDTMPTDLRGVLVKNDAARATWEDITPLARNEWLCWVESATLNETRQRRIKRAEEELAAGDRRPCCWIGCIHRTDKAISPSVKGILARRGKKTR
jgi:hypothetical protein